MSTFGLEKTFEPKRVVVVGGSPRPHSIGAIVLQNLIKGGFTGDITVVNSHYGEIAGLKTHPNLKALPFVPDLIVVTVPAPAIPEIITQA